MIIKVNMLIFSLNEITVWGSHASPNPKASQTSFQATKDDRIFVRKLLHEAIVSGSSNACCKSEFITGGKWVERNEYRMKP